MCLMLSTPQAGGGHIYTSSDCGGVLVPHDAVSRVHCYCAIYVTIVTTRTMEYYYSIIYYSHRRRCGNAHTNSAQNN